MSQSGVELKYKNETIVRISLPEAGQTDKKYTGSYAVKLQGATTGASTAKYFLKFPDLKTDAEKFFAEGFTGKLLTKFKAYDLIPAKYKDSFICADIYDFGKPHGLGLVQPNVKFKELFVRFNEGTASALSTDRSPLYEMFFGEGAYAEAFDALGALQNGLPFCAFMNLLLSNYSGFHSGNIVLLETQEESKEQKGVSLAPTTALEESEGESSLGDSMVMVKAPVKFGSIDQGASLRNIGSLKNKDVFNPFEDQSIKGKTTKGYIEFYKAYSGLFEAAAQEGQEFFIKKLVETGCGKTRLAEIILEVVRDIPSNMLDEKQIAQVQATIDMPSFKGAFCGNQDQDKIFADEMAQLLYQRMAAAANLTVEKIQELEKEALQSKLKLLAQEYKEIEEKNFLANQRHAALQAQQEKTAEQNLVLAQELATEKAQTAEKTAALQITKYQLAEAGQWMDEFKTQNKQLGIGFYQASLANYTAQKDSKYNAAAIFCSISITGSSIVVGAILYAGGLWVVGIGITSTTFIIPVLSIAKCSYDYYQARQIASVITAANNAQEYFGGLLEQKGADHEQKGKQELFCNKEILVNDFYHLSFIVSGLSAVPGKVKQQLYQDLKAGATAGKGMSKVCEDFIKNEKIKSSSYFRFFDRKASEEIISALEAFKTKVDQRKSVDLRLT